MKPRRPPIPKTVAAIVWARAKGKCACCGEPVKKGEHAIDHRPPLWSRERVDGLPDHDPEAYIPFANEPDNMELLHAYKSGEKCHDKRTFGHGTQRGDVTEAARSKEIRRKQDEFRATLLAKAGRAASEDVKETKRPKAKLQGRGFQGSRKFNGDITSKKEIKR